MSSPDVPVASVETPYYNTNQGEVARYSLEEVVLKLLNTSLAENRNPETWVYDDGSEPVAPE